MDFFRLLVTFMTVFVLLTEIHCRRLKDKSDATSTSSEPSIGKSIKTAIVSEIPGLVSLAIDTLKGLVNRQPKPADVQDNLAPIPEHSGPIPRKPTEQAMPNLEQSMPGFPFGPMMPGRPPQFPFTSHFYQESQESLHSGSAITKCNQLAILSIIIARIMVFL